MNLDQRIRAALSPDMVPLYEQAERFAEEGRFERAEKIFARLLESNPGNAALQRRLSELRDQGVATPPDAAAEFQDEVDRTARSLLRDLGYGESDWDAGALALKEGLGGLFRLGPDSFRRVGLDASIFAGTSGDWAVALEFAQKLLDLGEGGLSVKLWQLRCLVELDRFAEALAIVNSVRWTETERIHVNYLAGVAFESLGLADQARQRFDAVYKADARYRNIAQKVLQA